VLPGVQQHNETLTVTATQEMLNCLTGQVFNSLLFVSFETEKQLFM
jgi:hypothetical protein